MNGPSVPSEQARIVMPLNTAFLCAQWTAQAIVFGDVNTDGVMDLDPMFTNGAMGRVGSQ